MRDLRRAIRTLFKTPFMTTVAVLSIALGIGANAAIFSLFEQLLLRPLPVWQPGRLVNLSAPGPKPGSTACGPAGECEATFSYAMFQDLERERTGFSGIAAHRWFPANVAYERQATSGEGVLVSGSYFPVLGLKPALGRLLGPADDQIGSGPPVAVLSHGFWVSRLGADPGVLDRTIEVNGQPLTIVGVAPRGFEGTILGTRPQVFVPLAQTTSVQPWLDAFDDRRIYWVYLFGRLNPGASVEQAERTVNSVYQRVLRDVEVPLQTGIGASTLEAFRGKRITLADGSRGQSILRAEVRTPMILLSAVAGLVLLIACANIANLLLARGTGRGREIAVRLSLGAGRRRVVAQLLTESLVLAALGGVASLFVAEWTLAGIATLLPQSSSAMLALGLRGPVVIFAAALALGTGLLFGLTPALHSTRTDLVTVLRGNSGQATGTRSATRLRSTLVVVQLALSVTLLIGAGLFLRSLMNVGRVDLGVQVDRVVTFGIAPAFNGYPSDRSGLLLERVEEELATLPGVTGVTASAFPILMGWSNGSTVAVEGFAKGPDTDASSRVNLVGPGYYRTMGTPLLGGREFTPADRAGAPRVAIVNEAFARKFNLGRDAVGKRMGIGGEELDIEIVGVAQDAKLSGVKDGVPPLVVTPYRQSEDVGGLYFYVRTAGDPEQLLRSVPEVIAQLDPNLPVQDLKTMPQQVRDNVFLDRLITTLAAAFATLAMMLAAIGLYGVLSYSVAQRTREIGIRMALGGDARRVRTLVLGQVLRMFLIGGTIGVLAAHGLGRVAESLLFGVSGGDPVVFSLSVVLLAVVAVGAGYLPARRAARVDPVQALRYD